MLTLLFYLLWFSLTVSGLVALTVAVQELRGWLGPKVRRRRGFDRAPRRVAAVSGDHFATWERELVNH